MSYIYVMNIFSQSFTCFLLFLTMLSDEHFLKILMKFLKNILYFLAKKNFPTPNIQRYSSVFFHSFIVLAFRQFRSVVHLKFLCMPRGRNQIFFISLSHHHALKRLCFSPLNGSGALGTTQMTVYMWILDSLFYSIGLFIYTYINLYCLDYSSFIVNLEIW